MVSINEFLEAVEAYMLKRTEQIYLNKSVAQAYTDVSRIIVTSLEKRNIVLNEQQKDELIEEIKDEILDSLDVIIYHSYKCGFEDALKYRGIMKEMK